MTKKPSGRTLARLEVRRDVCQELLDGVREIKAAVESGMLLTLALPLCVHG